MLSKLSCYQVKIGCYSCNVFYVRLMVTTKEEPVVDTQKITLKESKHTLIHQDFKIYLRKKLLKQEKITTQDTERNTM